jgi:membrane protease YdiL (CAAX protease family)
MRAGEGQRRDAAQQELRMPPIQQSVDEASSHTIASRSRSPLTFFVLVFALSMPFWVFGAVTRLQLLPGLPVGALMAVCPLIAAAMLVYREHKTAGVTELLKRAFDYQRISAKVWYAPIVLLMPGVMVLSYGLMRVMRLPLPTPQCSILAALVLCLAFFIPAVGEEVGWSGYVIDPMQERWNALQASVLLGLVWATWHIVPLVQAHRSPAWIAGWCLSTVASRVLIVWLYNNMGKSVFAAVLYHAISNVSWLLFPNDGSHYDPRITGLITACAAAIVTVVWGPRTLARYRNA